MAKRSKTAAAGVAQVSTVLMMVPSQDKLERVAKLNMWMVNNDPLVATPNGNSRWMDGITTSQ